MKNYLSIIIVLLAMFCMQDAMAQRTRKADRKTKRATESEIKAKDSKTRSSESATTVISETVSSDNAEATVVTEEIISQKELERHTTPIISDKQNGKVNWTEQYIEAKGSSVIDNERFTNPAQAKAMATRGAIVVAQRNLLEIIQGVNVTSETTVQDMMTKSDFIYTRVDGVVKGARQYGEAIEKDGMIEVTMRISIYETNGLAPVLFDEVGRLPEMNLKKGAQQIDNDKNAKAPNGLVFDFGGKKYDPSMFPVVVDQSGRVLLDLSKVYDVKSGKFPKILSGTKEIFNDLNFKEGTEIIKVIESYNGKIVIDKESTNKINWEKVQKGLTTASKVFKFILTLV